MSGNLENVFQLYKLDYDKGVDAALKLEQTKITYQRYFISLVTAIGTISIGFLKSDFLKSGGELTIENLIGFLLLMSSALGYVLIRNLVSVRRQTIWFNNSIIYLRGKLIEKFGLSDEFPTLSKVPENHRDSADYISILVCSGMNLIMIICGALLLLHNGKDIKLISLGVQLGAIAVGYGVIHIFTIEKLLVKNL